MNKFYLVICLIFQVVIANGQPPSFKYHPSATFKIGRGFNLLNFSEPKRDFLESSVLDRQSRESSNISIRAITNESDLNEIQNFSSEVDASYLAFSASGALNLEKSYLYNKKQLAIAIIANASFGTEYLTKEVLTPEARSLTRNPKEFRNRFGDYYISGQKLGQTIIILCKISDVNEELKKNLTASLSGGISIGAFDASMSATFNEVMSQANRDRKLEYESYKLGSYNYEKDAEILNSLKGITDFNTTIASIQSILAAHLLKFNIDNASITEFFYSPFSNFGIPVVSPNSYMNVRFQKLKVITDFYRRVQTDIELINEIKLLPYYSEYKFIGDNDYLDSAKTNLERYLLKLTQAHQNCLDKLCDLNKSSCCTLPTDENRYDDFFNPTKKINEIEENLSIAFSKYSRGPYEGLTMVNPNIINAEAYFVKTSYKIPDTKTDVTDIEPNIFDISPASTKKIRFVLAFEMIYPVVNPPNWGEYVPLIQILTATHISQRATLVINRDGSKVGSSASYSGSFTAPINFDLPFNNDPIGAFDPNNQSAGLGISKRFYWASDWKNETEAAPVDNLIFQYTGLVNSIRNINLNSVKIKNYTFKVEVQ
ncbi:MAG: hypothetical protein P0Y49_13605 [Candidatus Pedobacter colombiensis]|uniref:MACPF domain-containing protein n=1 Tax=Candidatus Pedobacter colombiensis TaxID=3121371 RepID=A0AAJ5W6E4_9SPHI|nr:hypothetical protein [Pedobacter sp.]WEK17834.1 MAG: hypothetical protein P0Y49_13605 [Pedobacter sp.]